MGTRRCAGWLAGAALFGAASCGGGAGTEESAVSTGPMFEAALSAIEVDTAASGGEQLMETIGVPDAFSVSFESDVEDGPLVRRETWQYLELGSEFELVDGEVMGFVPLDLDPADGSTTWLSAAWLDVRGFTPETTLDDVTAMLDDPAVLVQTELPTDLGGLTAYAGDQLLVVFAGESLVHAETFFLTPAEVTP